MQWTSSSAVRESGSALESSTEPTTCCHSIALHAPNAWTAGIDQDGRPLTDGECLRKPIVAHYRTAVPDEKSCEFPLLRAAYIYGDRLVARSVELA
jgi:hypothetical protein